jgi:hypothetical protein
MSSEITEAEARLALSSIARRRQQVVAEIDVPSWYWISVAAGWVALGVLASYGPAWGATAGTLAFGAGHAAVAPRILSGRHGSRLVSIRADVVSRHVASLVFAFLLVMTMVTVALALILHDDGARHAAVLASVVVASLVLAGGPSVMASVRRRAEQRLDLS